MTEKEYDDDIEAKMLQMFGDESKENKPNENVRRSSRSRKKISHYKDEQNAAILHKVEKKYKTFSIEYYELDSEDLGNEILSDRGSSSFVKEEDNPSVQVNIGQKLFFCRTWGEHVVYKNCSECPKKILYTIDTRIFFSSKTVL